MKMTSVAIAFGPAALVLAAKFLLEPAWLKDWNLPACLALGVIIGGFGAVAAYIQGGTSDE